MCYMFKPLLKEHLRLTSITRSNYYQFIMNSAVLNKYFKESYIVNTIATLDGLPTTSRDFSVVTFLKQSIHVKVKMYNDFDIFTSDLRVIRLPPPYDTRCLYRLSDEMHDCKKKCQLQAFADSDAVPTNEIITEPLDKKVLGSKNMKTAADDDKIADVNARCRKNCYFNPCSQFYTKTSVMPRLNNHSGLGFSTRTSYEPDITTEFVASSTFVEFFSFLCGCFGIWFGVSFLSIDPFADVKLAPTAIIKKLPSKRSSVKPIGVQQILDHYYARAYTRSGFNRDKTRNSWYNY